MRFLRNLAIFLVATFAMQIVSDAQQTPNIGLRVPTFNSQNWNVPLNYNFTLLDQIIAGQQQFAFVGLQYRPIFSSSAPNNATCSANNNGQEYYYNNGLDITIFTCNSSSLAWQLVGFANPMTSLGDMIYGSNANGNPARLAVGSNGQVLTVVNGIPTWQTNSASFPYPAAGIPLSTGTAWGGSYSTIGGGLYIPLVPALGSTGQVLTINSSGALEWQAAGGFAYPAAGVVQSTSTGWGPSLQTTGGGTLLPLVPTLGNNGQVLGIANGALAWFNVPGFANPMTSAGDTIYGGTNGVATRLGIGSNGQVLGIVGGLPSWINNTALTNPMTTIGDMIYATDNSGTPGRLAAGTAGYILTANGAGALPSWQPAFTNPMTATGDIIYGASGGAPTRLAIGASGYLLASNGTNPVWVSNTSLTNPMSAVGDMIYGSTNGAPTRLAAGTAGDFLQTNGATGSPTWVAPSAMSVGTATNLAGGSTYSIPYQDAAGSTSMLSPGTAGNCLISGGTTSVPSWGNCSGGGTGGTVSVYSIFPSTPIVFTNTETTLLSMTLPANSVTGGVSHMGHCYFWMQAESTAGTNVDIKINQSVASQGTIIAGVQGTSLSLGTSGFVPARFSAAGDTSIATVSSLTTAQVSVAFDFYTGVFGNNVAQTISVTGTGSSSTVNISAYGACVVYN